MSVNGRGEMTSGSLGLFRTAALVALLAGAGGSLGLLLRSGQRTPRLLLIIMAIWVLSPFIALAWAGLVSKRWPVPIRTALYGVMPAVTMGSLAIYGDDALHHRTAHAAVVYVIVPPVSWLLIAIVVGMAAIKSGRRSGRRDGA